MSYPKRVKEFIPWTKAMVAGATVDRPNYDSSMKKMTKRRRRRKRRRKRTNGSKD